MKNSFIKTISYIAVLLVISLVIGFAIFLTNGFTEAPKNFYVEIGNERVASSTGGYTFEKGKPTDVKLIFIGNGSKEYSVKITPKADYDFSFIAGGEEVKFSAMKDYTDCFNIVKKDNGFSIEPKGTLYGILKGKYSDKDIEIDRSAIPDGDMFTLEIKAASDEATVKIGFKVPNPEAEILIEPTEVVI